MKFLKADFTVKLYFYVGFAHLLKAKHALIDTFKKGKEIFTTESYIG